MPAIRNASATSSPSVRTSDPAPVPGSPDAMTRRAALAAVAACAGLSACMSGRAAAGRDEGTAGRGSAGVGTPPPDASAPDTDARNPLARPTDAVLFPISLAQWSLHRTIRGGELEAIDFPVSARRDYQLDGVEYVNTFMMRDAPNDTRPRDDAWRTELAKRCSDHGVTSVLVMCDGLGMLGHENEKTRLGAVDRHKPWVEFAAALGCTAIRVNAASSGSWDEQRDRAAAGLRALCEFADEHGLFVIVENHGGLSSNGRWLAETIRRVKHPRAGTLPDFGNFALGDGTTYDRYQGIAELMPFARGVSAKSHDFDADGNETSTDYRRMLGIVLDAGYRGWVGIEYEGNRLDERAGILATKALLERVRAEETPRRPGQGPLTNPKDSDVRPRPQG